MKITVSISHDFESVQAAIAFAAKLEPITKELEAPAPALVAAADKTHFEEVREAAETINQPLADQIPTVEKAKRHRRTKEQIAADEAREASLTPTVAPTVAATEGPAPKPAAAAVVDAIDYFDAPIDQPEPIAEMSEDAFKIEFQSFVSMPGWREYLAKLFKEMKITRMGEVKPADRAAVASKLRSYIAAPQAAA